MLLELLHRVAAHAGANGMDAGALGEVFAPCIAWQPPPPKKVLAPPCKTLYSQHFPRVHFRRGFYALYCLAAAASQESGPSLSACTPMPLGVWQ